MTTLLIPAAGLSTRFGLSRPKFLLQHPTDGTMLQASLAGFREFAQSGVTSIKVVTLQDYFSDLDPKRMGDAIESVYQVPVNFQLLREPTGSMVETISLGLEDIAIDGPIIVKDCDNQMGLNLKEFAAHDNAIAFADLRKHPHVVAHNKSFIDLGPDLIVKSLVEKAIQGPYINVGCVKFASASDFLAAAKELSVSREKYVSDIVSAMLDWGSIFRAEEVEDYSDWGTLEEWLGYTGTFRTLFVDIDGVVAENAHPLGLDNNWSHFQPLTENAVYLRTLNESGRVKLVFTTARTESYRESLASQLHDFGFRNFELVMGLPHSRRVLINDFAVTNPYPSASAISLPRNARNLKSYLC